MRLTSYDIVNFVPGYLHPPNKFKVYNMKRVADRLVS